MNKITIVFWSGTGNTEAMANYIAEEVRAQPGPDYSDWLYIFIFGRNWPQRF